MSSTRNRARSLALAAAALLGVWLASGPLEQASAQPRPEGEMRWALYVTLSPLWFDPAEIGGLTPFWVLYAILDAVVKPLPGNLLTPSLAESWTVRPEIPVGRPAVRLAASYAIDRLALSEAETLGASKPVGSIVPRTFEFALPIEPSPYDPGKAKQLLAEAGYPNGFDAGDLHQLPPYFSMGETIMGYLKAVGIKLKMRSMERAAYTQALLAKKLRGVCVCATALYGNAASRMSELVPSVGAYAYGSYPEIDACTRSRPS
jgi:ABC-type transport system substrate-binding protein